MGHFKLTYNAPMEFDLQVQKGLISLLYLIQQSTTNNRGSQFCIRKLTSKKVDTLSKMDSFDLEVPEA